VLMKITSPKLHTLHLTANEEALLRCQTALELKDRGCYEGAGEAMGPLWTHVGERPKTEGLYPSVAAEVLLCVGILTRWIGSKDQLLKESQDMARDLISESITFYESAGDVKKIAAARAELAYCYWWEGALDEARIMFNESLQKLTVEGNTRATALLGLAVVEWSASRYNEACRILTENVSLFNKITNHATKGAYHSQLAMVLRELAPSENRDDYFMRAVKEYEEADHHFKLARNIVFRSDVKNNVGNLLRQLSRFKEAHKYVTEARRLAIKVRDKVRAAQFDDTRAQVFIAEGKFKEAEAVAKSAVRVLEKSGHQCLLTDALVTYGIALARLGQTQRAQFTFQKAIEVAHQVGALNKAGLAALTLIEELEELSPDALYAAYDRASDWLAKSQSQDLLLRLNSAARRVFSTLRGELKAEAATEAILNKPCSLPTEVLKFEASLIRQALTQANASVTRAAALLGMSYQGLAYVIGSRHKDLLKERSPIRRRSRKLEQVEPPAT
ncbi:MAG TPA: helix-turn-helix domain-containing protein, partial [Pyrinomonadaceae bacterium]|nr:helix-turn-helix domain-containing protein [Pyrinomonadaceae bacterium]